MLLGKEYSLVADSTISSSPHSDSDTLTHIRRPVKTYGRRRDDGPTNDVPSSSLASSSTSRGSIHNTAPPGLSEEVPPSSPPHFSDCEISMNDADEQGSPRSSSKFEFAWRKGLRQLDEDDDLDPNTSFFSNTEDDASKQVLLESTNATASALLDDVDVFGGSHSSVDTRSPLHSVSFRLSSPQVSTRTRTHRKLKVIRDSDSDSEPSKESPSTTPASALHLLNTPHSGSSSTQPTSEDDMPAQVSTKLTGRRKMAPSSRVSVTPLTFNEGPSKNEIRSEEMRKKKTKLKAPTKKDLVDTIKERGRLAAQSVVIIPRNEKKTKFTVGNLLAKVQDGVFKPHSVLGDRMPASDPIEAFSSPNNAKCGTPERSVSSCRLPHQSAALSNRDQEFPDQHDSDDSDLPEISNMFKQNVEDSRRKQVLKEAKERALARLQPPTAMDGGDDDDDLEILAYSGAKTVVKEDIQRKSGKKPRISEGRKRQMQFGKVSLTVQEKERMFTLSPGRGGLVKLADQTTLNQLIAIEARKEAQRVTRKKEEEWQKHGGQINTNVIGQGQGLANVVKTIAEKGLKAAEARKTDKADMDDSDDEGSSDEDWKPELRGSASPKILPTGAESEPDESVPPNEDATMVDVMEDDANIRVRTARRCIVDSESEDENQNQNQNENAHPELLAIQREERYRRSTSSCELPTEDEYDKENNVNLMYDRSEDKENNAVVRHSTSIFDIRGNFPSLPDFTQSDSQNEKAPLDEELNSDRRRPLGELMSEESSMASPIGRANLTQSFAAKLQQASPSSDTLTPFLACEKGLQPAFDRFSQFSEGEPDIFCPAPLLQPGFADLFESATERQKSPRELSGDRHSVAEELKKLRRTDTLNLTQDVTLAFQAENKLIRKADAIFEKEQAFVLEAATRKIHNSKPDLYVNELGFLTQTRPGVQSPEVYRPPSPTQSLSSVSRQQSFLSPFPTRSPLRTLSFTSQLDSPEREPPRRLKRYSSPSRSRGPYGPEGTKPPKLNAFELLAAGRETTAKKDHRERKRLDLSEFLADEAAESDDDDKFGFTKVTSKDDEEDGEDMDKTLDVLMDDRDMDEDVVAADLVHEKFKEQEDEQDKEIEKLHLAAIQGELRLKRNRGVGVDDSDEESDNEENERARRAMKKLRTTDRGDIKDLEANADTRAFADTYNQSLKDDDQEFAYLEKESQSETPAVDVGYKSNDDEGEEEDEPQEYISPDEMRRLVRERAKEEIDEDDMDTNDISWLDLQEEEQPRVKTLNTFKRYMAQSQNLEQSEVEESLGPAFRKSVPSATGLNKRFVRENKSRNTGTSRSVGGSAVTGHTKNKSKTGAPSKVVRGTNSSSTSTVNRQVKPAESMLSVIADKSHHFA
ncbi:hypothetical protein BYT27DRAFT_7302755 [Phlegmacium glaucopus]|nr:hypothetical protein BYT27DRAFT_7302755 [Phlegmacium glaucopus]